MPGDLVLHQCQHLTVYQFRWDVTAKTGVVDHIHGLAANMCNLDYLVLFVNYQSGKKRFGHGMDPFSIWQNGRLWLQGTGWLNQPSDDASRSPLYRFFRS